MHRLTDPFSRARAEWLFLASAVLVFAAFAIGGAVALGAGPDGSGDRAAWGQLWVSVLAMAGIVLTLGAGIVELNQVFPSQSLTLTARRREGDFWELEIENGNAITSACRVEGVVRVSGSGSATQQPVAVEPQTGSPLARYWRNEGAGAFAFERDAPLFPKQTLQSPRFHAPSAERFENAKLTWTLRYWTDRSGPVAVGITAPADSTPDTPHRLT